MADENKLFSYINGIKFFFVYLQHGH